MTVKKSILLTAVFTICLFSVSADMSFRGMYYDYLFVEELAGNYESTSLMYHSYSKDAGRTTLPDWSGRQFAYPIVETSLGTLSYMPPETFLSYNSHKAFGMNDGALWQGRGFNNVSSVGIEWMSDWFSIRINPEFWWAENRDFEIIDTSISSGWGDYWDGTRYDRLQRMGDSFVTQFNWGQSDIRFYWKDYLTLGLSNEEVKLGSGRKNNILLSNNAGGFPHFDLGTYRPQDIWVLGSFEAHVFWGALKESDYYDDNPDNDYAWFSGMTVGWSPSFADGLTLGANHIYYKPMQYWNALDLVAACPIFSSNKVGADDDEDGMISVDFNWKFPSIGFTVYGEWANNDYTNIMYGPEHTSAYVLGLSQILKTWNPGQRLVFSFEHANLGQTRTTAVRAAGPWYRHGFAGWRQGYAHNGQLPGAAIGPGSNSQWADFSYYHNKGKVSFSYMRICYDSDYFYNVVIKDPDYHKSTFGQYIDNVMTVDTLYFLGNWNLYGQFSLIATANNNWVWKDNLVHVHAETGLSYSY